MFGTHGVEVSSIIGVEILKPNHASDAVDSVCDLGRLVATELLAATNHGYNSRERLDTCGRCGPRSHDFYDVNVALFRLS